MKKFFVFSLLALPLAASAQFTKGNMFLGGSLSVMLQNNNPTSPPLNLISPSTQTNNFSLAPSVGFFINEKTVLGVSLSYSAVIQKYDYSRYPQLTSYTSKTEGSSFGLSPYIRYYLPISTTIYVGLQGGLSFSRGTTTFTEFNGGNLQETDIPSYQLGMSFRPIFIFFPSPKWGVEASIGSLGYTYVRNLPDNGSSNSFGLNAGSFSFGIAYYFIKK